MKVRVRVRVEVRVRFRIGLCQYVSVLPSRILVRFRG
jgi:hypothetical protein